MRLSDHGHKGKPDSPGARLTRRSPFEQPLAPVLPKKKRRNPFILPTVSDENRQHLQPEELKAFFRAIPQSQPWHAYFFLQYFFGCRLSEPALAMDDDLNRERRTFMVRRLRRVYQEQGYDACNYPVDSRIIDCVDAAIVWKDRKGLGANPFVFPSNRHRESAAIGAERLSQLRNIDGHQAVSRFTAHRMFQKIADDTKMPKRLQHPHVLRHTRAVVMLALGSPVDHVQWFLGHSTVKMTQRYKGAAMTMRGQIDQEFLTLGLGL